jgi:hypothetical protein
VSTRLGASLSEDGGRAGSRNVVFKKLDDGQRQQKKEIVSVNHTLSSKSNSVKFDVIYVAISR